jgi:hypothetical protein
MNDIVVQYVGFTAREIAREYSFVVREIPGESREFTFSISNEAFNAHRARYQDGPNICSLKLYRELATSLNHPLETHYAITETELDTYRDSHAVKAPKSFSPQQRPARDP